MADINIEGSDVFQEKINAIIAAKQAALKAAGQTVLQDLLENYNSEGNKYGAGWSPRVDPIGDWKLLHHTGHLMSSINMVSDDDSVSIGTNVPYAAALNFGYEPHGLCARPFIFFNDQIANDFMNSYLAQIKKVV